MNSHAQVQYPLFAHSIITYSKKYMFSYSSYVFTFDKESRDMWILIYVTFSSLSDVLIRVYMWTFIWMSTHVFMGWLPASIYTIFEKQCIYIYILCLKQWFNSTQSLISLHKVFHDPIISYPVYSVLTIYYMRSSPVLLRREAATNWKSFPNTVLPHVRVFLVGLLASRDGNG